MGAHKGRFKKKTPTEEVGLCFFGVFAWFFRQIFFGVFLLPMQRIVQKRNKNELRLKTPWAFLASGVRLAEWVPPVGGALSRHTSTWQVQAAGAHTNT
jgi:hypothetical protein